MNQVECTYVMKRKWTGDVQEEYQYLLKRKREIENSQEESSKERKRQAKTNDTVYCKRCRVTVDLDLNSPSYGHMEDFERIPNTDFSTAVQDNVGADWSDESLLISSQVANNVADSATSGREGLNRMPNVLHQAPFDHALQWSNTPNVSDTIEQEPVQQSWIDEVLRSPARPCENSNSATQQPKTPNLNDAVETADKIFEQETIDQNWIEDFLLSPIPFYKSFNDPFVDRGAQNRESSSQLGRDSFDLASRDPKTPIVTDTNDPADKILEKGTVDESWIDSFLDSPTPVYKTINDNAVDQGLQESWFAMQRHGRAPIRG